MVQAPRRVWEPRDRQVGRGAVGLVARCPWFRLLGRGAFRRRPAQRRLFAKVQAKVVAKKQFLRIAEMQVQAKLPVPPPVPRHRKRQGRGGGPILIHKP